VLGWVCSTSPCRPFSGSDCSPGGDRRAAAPASQSVRLARGRVALVLWSPWIIWQADNGWPQIDVSEEIAAGESASSEPWWAIVPFQLLMISPLLAPIWIAGLVRLFRDPAVREMRFIAWTWVVLAVLFMATGGKPYYLAGLLPALLGAARFGWMNGSSMAAAASARRRSPERSASAP
jgi:hypothetical protein